MSNRIALAILLLAAAAPPGAGGQGQEPPAEPELVVEEEVTVVASTRTGRRIEDQPLRVEALNREEIEEKMLMTPGDVVMLLNEMGGMRVRTTSPSLGAASVRNLDHPTTNTGLELLGTFRRPPFGGCRISG